MVNAAFQPFAPTLLVAIVVDVHQVAMVIQKLNVISNKDVKQNKTVRTTQSVSMENVIVHRHTSVLIVNVWK